MKALARFILLSVFFVSALLAGSLAHADRPTFGPEFNFTNPDLRAEGAKQGPLKKSSRANEAARDQMRDLISRICSQCRLESSPDNDGNTMHRFFHPNGWDFTLNLDVNVVEVTVSPMTTDEIKRNEKEMQRLIFDVAKRANLKSQATAGQLHIGIESAFQGSPLHFRNFIVDWIYHSKATYLLFGADHNAPTLDQLKSENQEKMKNIIAEFDQTLQAPKGVQGVLSKFGRRLNLKSEEKDLAQGRQKILDLAFQIATHAYTRTVQPWLPTSKFQNLNLNHIQGIPQTDTAELRGVPEFQSASEYLSFTQLLEGRLAYLGQLKEPIPFRGVFKTDSGEMAAKLMSRYAGQSNFDAAALQRFYVVKYRRLQLHYAACQTVYGH